jgi:hypothetical protein
MRRLGWAALRTIRLGELHVGIRVSSTEIDDALMSTLEAFGIDDPNAPPNYSIMQESLADHGGRRRYRIFVGCKHASTTRSLERAIAIVCGYLEDHLQRPVVDGQVELLALTLVHGDEALLAPWQLRFGAPTIEARLERQGIHVLERRLTTVAVAEKQVVISPLQLSPDARAGGEGRGFGAEARIGPGRYSLRGWLLSKSWRWEELTPGIATAYGMSVARIIDNPETTLQALATLLTGLPIAAIDSESDVAAQARALWA